MIIVFFFININAILNFLSAKIDNYHIFKNILWTNKLLLYLVPLILALYILTFLVYKTREILLKYFLSVDDYSSYKIQRSLLINKDPYSKFELKKRLQNINFKGLKKAFTSLVMLLSVLSIFSFAKFSIPRFENPFNEYISKFNIKQDKEEYLEGDSIFVLIDIPLADILLEYGNQVYPCNNNKIFIGLASPLHDRFSVKLFNNVVDRKVLVHGRPRLNDLFISSNYKDIIIREYRNVFDVSAFRNSQVIIKASFIGAQHDEVENKFFIDKDTNVVITFCNPHFCDSLEINFKAVEINKPTITYTKFEDTYLVKVLDDFGLKSLIVNGKAYSIDHNSRSVEFFLDTLQSYTVTAKNICNQISEIVVNKLKTIYNGANFSLDGSHSSSVLNDIESQLLELANELSENPRSYPFEKYNDILQNLEEILNTVFKENTGQNRMRANELKLLVSEVIEILKEIEKNVKLNKDILNESLIQKLKNTMNRYKNTMKQNEKNKETDSNTESLSISEQISLEYILLVSNNLSFDIESGIYKNVKDVYLNSLLPVMLDTLYSIMLRKSAIYDLLIKDYNSLRSLDYSSSAVDIRSLMFRLNNISVILYNLIKNTEQNLPGIQQDTDKNNKDSNCSNPNSGKSKKPGINELLGDSKQNGKEGEGESESNNEKERNDGSNTSDDGGDKESNKEGNNNTERKKSGNTGNGSNESLEEIEKKLRNLNSSEMSINNDLLKKKIKWLDYEYSKRINDEADNKRLGTYVIEKSENISVQKKDFNSIKLIRRSSLVPKRNDLY